MCMSSSQIEPPDSKTYDCLIVGAGPAGLSAAMQVRRQGHSVALFEEARPGGQALAANLIENFPGFPEGITGRELMERLVRQVERHGVPIISERVVSVRRSKETFVARTADNTFSGRALIVATGLAPKLLGVPGERELLGRRIFTYLEPLRLGHKFRRVAIIGGGDAAFDLALNYSRVASKVVILMRGTSPKCNPILLKRVQGCGIEVKTGLDVLSFSEGSDGVTIEVEGGSKSKLEVDVVITCIGKEPRADFLDPEIAKDHTPGMFWAGDCRRGRHRHIAIATGDGTVAAMKAAEYLHSERSEECRYSERGEESP